MNIEDVVRRRASNCYVVCCGGGGLSRGEGTPGPPLTRRLCRKKPDHLSDVVVVMHRLLYVLTTYDVTSCNCLYINQTCLNIWFDFLIASQSEVETKQSEDILLWYAVYR